MKSKLKLAIVCTILQFLIPLFLGRYPWFQGRAGFTAGAGEVLYFLSLLCSLGTLPFFISLYKSKNFLSLTADEAVSNPAGKDQYWLKHFLVRLFIVTGVCLALLGISAAVNSVDIVYLVVYGIAYTLGVAALVFCIEGLLLLKKQRFYKGYGSLILAGMALIFLFQLL